MNLNSHFGLVCTATTILSNSFLLSTAEFQLYRPTYPMSFQEDQFCMHHILFYFVAGQYFPVRVNGIRRYME